ncbi:guided entry of tail-anchored proteins factor 1-like [Hydractinia symbiolongicarpus]|uniref:guided entry of tail-anchored proteins factor 1-like n=1 Tax=Hydractinia symbiolongicarpus TaxID=13093 RepID=UPI00254A590A|nr:guided entry of tail-anchored proteins factor 1-like [Hydractinia symbiolongicarpus]
MTILMLVVGIVVSIEFIFCWLKNLVSWIYEICNDGYKTCEQLSRVLQDLKIKQKVINMQEEFAKYSRIQRKINKLSDQQSAVKKKRKFLLLRWTWKIRVFLNLVYAIFMMFVFYNYRSEPVIVLPESWFPYVNIVLAFPSNMTGGISLPVWLFICQQVTRVFLQ